MVGTVRPVTAEGGRFVNCRNGARTFVVFTRRGVMRGFITTRDVLLHPLRIIDAFGLRVYGRCLSRLVVRRGRATFLECI